MGKGKRLRAQKSVKQQVLPHVQDIVSCDECGGGFSLSAVGIDERKVKNEDLHVDCFICPHCNKVYVVFIKDAECIELQAEMKELEKRIKKLRGRKKFELSEHVHDLFNKRRQRLARHEEALKKKYSGTLTTAASEDNTVDIVYLPRR